jgi:hypothetical protein
VDKTARTCPAVAYASLEENNPNNQCHRTTKPSPKEKFKSRNKIAIKRPDPVTCPAQKPKI